MMGVDVLCVDLLCGVDVMCVWMCYVMFMWCVCGVDVWSL